MDLRTVPWYNRISPIVFQEYLPAYANLCLPLRLRLCLLPPDLVLLLLPCLFLSASLRPPDRHAQRHGALGPDRHQAATVPEEIRKHTRHTLRRAPWFLSDTRVYLARIPTPAIRCRTRFFGGRFRSLCSTCGAPRPPNS